MQKTIDITLNGSRFTLEERAYERLHAYISGLEAHFSHNAERGEILRDIESRIAEQFLANRKSGSEAVTDSEVAAVIKEIGSVSEIAALDDENDTPTDRASGATKKALYRDVNNAMLGGVCSGLAAYVGIDVTVMRILVVVLGVVFFPLPILIYFLMWFLVPAARTQVDKMKMRGEPVTVATIQAAHGQPQDATEDKTRGRLWGCLIAVLAFFLVIFMAIFGFFGMFSIASIRVDSASTPIETWTNWDGSVHIEQAW